MRILRLWLLGSFVSLVINHIFYLSYSSQSLIACRICQPGYHLSDIVVISRSGCWLALLGWLSATSYTHCRNLKFWLLGSFVSQVIRHILYLYSSPSLVSCDSLDSRYLPSRESLLLNFIFQQPHDLFLLPVSENILSGSSEFFKCPICHKLPCQYVQE